MLAIFVPGPFCSVCLTSAQINHLTGKHIFIFSFQQNIVINRLDCSYPKLMFITFRYKCTVHTLDPYFRRITYLMTWKEYMYFNIKKCILVDMLYNVCLGLNTSTLSLFPWECILYCQHAQCMLSQCPLSILYNVV